MTYNRSVHMNTPVWKFFRFFSAFLVLVSFFFSFSYSALAAITDATVSPAVLDGKGKAREILRFSLTITNTSKHLVTVYPWVTDFDPNAGSIGASDLGGSATKELASSLARWIEITRGSIDLLPGEKSEVPLTVQINLNAKPGVYHAVVHLSQGADRASAESNPKETQDVPVNVEVLEDINERLQLTTFAPMKNIFSNNNASFQYRIQNIGNRGEVPRGKVRIFNRDGREVATIEANQGGERLEPSASAMLSSVWASDGSFGRYKAMIDLEYGSRGTLQDTVFFWMFPWGKLMSMFLSLILVCVIVAVILHSRMTADRRSLSYASATSTNPKRKIREMIGGFFQKDDEEDEEAPEGEVEHVERHRVNELREVALPHPVHSRLASLKPDLPAGTRLHAQNSAQDPLGGHHRVTLGKQEKSKPDPQHVLNLRK